ncbi:MAG TPA: MarP family serine protease [Jiangellales bacterium]|nr:MarP family serine protease [Jiangellales bacterium]
MSFLGLNLLDWFLLLLVLVVAVTGWTQGFVVGLLSFVGFVGGAVGGLLLVPVLLGGLEPGLGTAVLAVLLVLITAFVGQGLLAWAGSAIRTRVAAGPARHVDAAGGALLAVAGLLVAAWAVGLAVASSTIPNAAAAARESAVLRVVDDVVPVSPERLREAFRSVVAAGRFPEVVAPWVPEPIAEVGPPSPALTRDAEIALASESVAKVVGRAAACGTILEGSAFVVAPERVMTNAHVVAGVSAPTVQIPGEDPLEAQVVYFDPQVDVAVLAVPGLTRAPLELRADVVPGADAVVVGFPNNGPLAGEPARVRSQQVLLGRDIYGDERVQREVVSVRADVAPGNSGGPLVADDGRVYGVVFAASLTDPDTGYALSPGAVADALAQAGASAAVDTGVCLAR